MHEMIRVGDVTATFLKCGEETGGQFCLCEFRLPPGGAAVVADRLMHLDYDEVVVGVDGLTVWEIGCDEVILRPGDRLHIPRRVAHRFRNAQQTPARFVSIYEPGVVDPKFFRELAQAAELHGPVRTLAIGDVLSRFRTIPVADS